uniref:Uncharacterized protein n=1 Tax=Panagrolaimus sp. JU765 TaxID=591449 RepID=A0AC34RHF9_9BILA
MYLQTCRRPSKIGFKLIWIPLEEYILRIVLWLSCAVFLGWIFVSVYRIFAFIAVEIQVLTDEVRGIHAVNQEIGKDTIYRITEQTQVTVQPEGGVAVAGLPMGGSNKEQITKMEEKMTMQELMSKKAPAGPKSFGLDKEVDSVSEGF